MEQHILTAALEGLEARKLRIDAQIGQVRHLLTGGTHTHIQGGSRTGSPKRTMSAAGRARIAAAQKKRWADVRAQKKADEKPPKIHVNPQASEKPKRAAKPRPELVAAAG